LCIDPAKSDGVLPTDRRHNLVLSFNWMTPALPASTFGWLRGMADGWQVSSIASFISGPPILPSFSGDLASAQTLQAWFGTPSIGSGSGIPGVAPIYLRDPRLSGARSVGERLLDVSAIAIPAFGQSGPAQPPYDMRLPWRTNVDVSLVRSVRLGASRTLQFRVGAFNVFNTAWGTDDVDLTLDASCLVKVANVPTGTGDVVPGEICDPAGGFELTPQTRQNFGKIGLLRGHRIIELAVKYLW